jgi:predicted adenine nucleotide alpha hydrolase (AANH) superfamily ATPase
MVKSLLLHVCCAHCAAYPIEYWRKQGYDVTAFFYNPNIHPYTEHQNRLEAVKVLAQQMNFPLLVAEGYDMPEYFRRVAENEADRCRYCFELRLSRTAAQAKHDGFNEFTATLLISRHQDHELIKETGDKAAQKFGVEFLYVDLRKRFSDSRVMSKPYRLYVQQYCGCVYSEWERYRDDIKSQNANLKTEES